jgi:hypothetical protein
MPPKRPIESPETPKSKSPVSVKSETETEIKPDVKQIFHVDHKDKLD